MSDSRPSNGIPIPSKSTIGILLALLIMGSLFVPTTMAYISYDSIQTADISVEETRLNESATSMIVEVSFHNPTNVEATVVGGYTEVRVDGLMVSQPASTFMENTTIPAGETKTVTMRVWLEEGRTGLAEQGIQQGTVKVNGELQVSIRNERIKLLYGEEER